MKDATVRDVAKLAGLSVGTVSRHLNGNEVSKKNKIKLEEAIKTLKYLPNPMARNLAKGRSYSVLLYFITESPIIASTWMHELPIIQGISDVIKSSKYNLIIEIANIEQVNEVAQTIDLYTRNKGIEGLLILTPWGIKTKILLPLEYRNFPYVLIGNAPEIEPSKIVEFDNYTPFYDIIMHQFEYGHREFALIGGFKNQYHMQQRTQGFINALKELGLDIPEDRMLYGDYSLQSGYDLTKKLFGGNNLPTMILCGNDQIAAGAIKAIEALGMRIPDDVSVSGFDASIVSEVMNPTITTVEVNAYRVGEIAIKKLLYRLDNNTYGFENEIIRTKIFYRESTGRVKDIT
jgi:DNA-binding LacI/PurR family transcriptional regulator